MEIIRELDKCLDFEKVQEIYAKGNKIAVSFNDKVELPFEVGIKTEESGSKFINLLNGEELPFTECVSGITISECGISFVAGGDLVVVESVCDDKCGHLAFVNPFKGCTDEDYQLCYFLYGDGEEPKIADRVVEVSI